MHMSFTKVKMLTYLVHIDRHDLNDDFNVVARLVNDVNV